MSDDLDWTGRNSLLIGPTLAAVAFGIATSHTPALTTGIVAAPLSTQYLRLYTLNIQSLIDLVGLYNGDVDVHWALTDDSLTALLLGSVGSTEKTEPLTFAGGLPFPFGSGINIIPSSAGWADGSISVSVTYSVVG